MGIHLSQVPGKWQETSREMIQKGLLHPGFLFINMYDEQKS